MQPTSADLDGIASEVASRLGSDADPVAVRALLLGAWWQWAGIVAQRGGVMDSERVPEPAGGRGPARAAAPVAERAIEIEIAYLHGIGGARRRAAARARGRSRAAAEHRLADAGRRRRVRRARRPGRRRARARPARRRTSRCRAARTQADTAAVPRLDRDPRRRRRAARRVRRLAPRPARRAGACGSRSSACSGSALFSLGLLAGAQWLEYSAGALFVLAGAAAWLTQKLDRQHAPGRRRAAC